VNGDRICSTNFAAMLGLGLTARMISPQQYRELIHPEDQEMVRTIVDCALQDHLSFYEYQARFIVREGCQRVLFTHGELTFDFSNRLIKCIGVTQDVTRTVAIHERTSQSLAGMLMTVQALADDPTFTPSLRGAIERCQAITSDAIQELNSLSHLLHPPLLEEGLAFAIAWHAARFSIASGIRVSTEIQEDLGRLPEAFERALFRVVQECLTNIERHSGSRWARVCVRREREAVALLVEDGGKGMPKEQRRDLKAVHWNFGIPVMRERVRQLHGSFAIESSSKGVVVRATLPAPAVANLD
jgi:signal transduction histidine kinase